MDCTLTTGKGYQRDFAKFFVLRVENIQKRLYKEIQCSLGPHLCYSEGIYIFGLEGKVNFVKPLKFSKKMQANMGIPEIGSKFFFLKI